MNEETYTLKHPITWQSKAENAAPETITHLTLQRPKAKHMKVMDKVQGDTAKLLALVAACSSRPQALVDEIDAEDLIEIGGIVEGFLGRSRPIGAMS